VGASTAEKEIGKENDSLRAEEASPQAKLETLRPFLISVVEFRFPNITCPTKRY